MEKHKDLDVGDIYYHSSNEFYAYIFVDKSNSTRLNDIKNLISYFGGTFIDEEMGGLIMASNFKTKEQAIYFRKTLIMEYG
jgi:hypothetical protein